MHRALDQVELADVSNSIHHDGFAIINNFLGADLIAELLKKINHEYSQTSHREILGVPDRDVDDKVLYNLQSLDKKFIDILCFEPVVEIAKNFLNDPYYRHLESDLPNFTLNYFNARSSGAKLDLHIDSGAPFKGEYPTAMQFVFLLEDSNENNGCTVIVPQSHQSGKYSDRSLDLSDQVKLEGKSGDLIIWDSRTWHGALENTSGLSRWAIIATLTRWWIKPAMDIVRTIDEEMYARCSDHQKQLLGFCSIPPTNPFERVNTKCGYEFLRPKLADYDL